jgi:hypothetical protein
MHKGQARVARYHSDGSLLASGSADGSLKVGSRCRPARLVLHATTLMQPRQLRFPPPSPWQGNLFRHWQVIDSVKMRLVSNDADAADDAKPLIRTLSSPSHPNHPNP